MTDYGLTVRNQDLKIQIDSQFKNFTYYDSGSGAVAANTMTELSGFTSTSGALHSFLKLDSTDMMFIQGYRLTTGKYDRIRIASDGVATAYWMMYQETQPTSPPADSYGLLVRNEDNEIVFNSLDVGWVDVVAFHSFSLPGTFAGTTDITVDDADNNYFQIAGSAWGLELISETIRYDYCLGVRKTSSTNARIGWVKFLSSAYSDVGSGSGAASNSPFNLIEIKKPPSI